jgi:diguanylate cyclase (GGDEF)-like protein/PAS domain S-box-containing protein
LASPPSLTARLQRQQAALLSIARSWKNYESDVDVALRAITETAADALDIDRVSVWLLGDDPSTLVCEDLFDRRQAQHSEGLVLRAQEYPAYFTALQTEEVIAADNAHQDQRTREFSASYLTPLGIGAMLDAPIRVAGRVRGVVCHEHVGGPREFQIDEQNAASYLASLASLTLEFRRRTQMELELAHSLSLLRAAFEATGEAILAVDQNGSVVEHNRRFIEMWQIPEELLGKAGDGGPRLEFLGRQTKDPAGFVRRARELSTERTTESLDQLDLLDGRTIERTGRPQWLNGEVIGRVWSYRDISKSKRVEEALRESEARQREIANHDGLTGLHNRRHILERLNEEVARSERTLERFSVAMLDLDHFKQVNDEHGHVVGDDVLRTFARELTARLRKTDRAGRYGGEEFLIVLPHTRVAGARQLVEDVREHVARKRENMPHFTVSAGVAEYPGDATEVTRLIEVADERLYQAKREGRNRVR